MSIDPLAAVLAATCGTSMVACAAMGAHAARETSNGTLQSQRRNATLELQGTSSRVALLCVCCFESWRLLLLVPLCSTDLPLFSPCLGSGGGSSLGAPPPPLPDALPGWSSSSGGSSSPESLGFLAFFFGLSCGFSCQGPMKHSSNCLDSM